MADTKKSKPDPDLSALEGKVIDEEREITQPAATHEDILAAQEEERRAHDVEHAVQTVAGHRSIARGYPPPATSSYIILPVDLWPEGVDPDLHKGHAWQVRQVRTYAGDSPPTVNVVCDCGAEMTFLWDADHAEAVANVTEDDLAALREVPEEFAEPARRSDPQT